MSYLQLITSLAKPGEEILESLTPRDAHLLHMAIGLAGEISELLEWAPLAARARGPNPDAEVRENLTEEFGDILFYLALIADAYGTTLMPPQIPEVTASRTPDPELFFALAVQAGSIVDSIKRQVIYQQPDAPAPLLNPFYFLLRLLIAQVGLTLVTVTQHNIRKLGRRYPQFTYSDMAANARADKLQ